MHQDSIDSETDTSDQLLNYLEFRAGRLLRSRRAIDAYVAVVAAEEEGARRRSRSLRLTAVMSAVALTFLFYYFMDVGAQISAIRSNVLTPAAATAPLLQFGSRFRS